MIVINYRDPRPIYEQIKDELKKLIISGVMKPDEKLPSVRMLATELSINPNTIQRAYNELESEGFIYSVSGKGSFVSFDSDKQKEHIDELKDRLKSVLKELRALNVNEEELESLLGEGRE